MAFLAKHGLSPPYSLLGGNIFKAAIRIQKNYCKKAYNLGPFEFGYYTRKCSNSQALIAFPLMLQNRNMSHTQMADSIINEDKRKVPKTVFTMLAYIKDNGTKVPDDNKAITLIDFLTRDKIPPHDISEGLKRNAELFNEPIDKWQKAITLVRDYGFRDHQVMSVLVHHKKLFHGNAEHLYLIGETLRNMGFHDGALHKMIVSCPIILSMKSKDVVQRYNQLLEVFKRKEIVNMFLECPSLMTDSWKDIEERKNYMSEKMGISPASMVRKNIFKYSMMHIKTRHQCLLRLGYYQRPDPKGLIHYENATLNEMLEFGDKSFAKKVAKISLEEYNAFVKMIEFETEEEKALEKKLLGTDEDESDSDDELD